MIKQRKAVGLTLFIVKTIKFIHIYHALSRCLVSAIKCQKSLLTYSVLMDKNQKYPHNFTDYQIQIKN